MPCAIIYIIRHGETDENKQGILQGQLDTVLNVNGLRQAQQVAEALQSIQFDVAFSSDLERAVKVWSYVCYLVHSLGWPRKVDRWENFGLPPNGPASESRSFTREGTD